MENIVFAPEFQNLFQLSEKDQNEVDSLVLAAQFLSHFTTILDERNISRKHLAQQIGVSPSWLTQIFRGDKLPNWETIVKIQKYLVSEKLEKCEKVILKFADSNALQFVE